MNLLAMASTAADAASRRSCVRSRRHRESAEIKALVHAVSARPAIRDITTWTRRATETVTKTCEGGSSNPSHTIPPVSRLARTAIW